MGRKAGRTPEQTRRLALDAAAKVFRTHGVGATLDDVARAAGLSKGGLVYHFKSKDELLRALIDDIIDGWRQVVMDELEPGDDAPGRLMRAYVRANLKRRHDHHEMRDAFALSVQLVSDPQVAAALEADGERWAADLAGDGLPDDVVRLIVAAADGAGVLSEWGGSDETSSTTLGRQLVALTRAPDALSRLLADTDR
jgi:AcrR family transcriptional regulator